MSRGNPFHPSVNPVFAHADKGGRTQIRVLVRKVREGELVIPEYQRGRKWTTEQKSLWVGYVLSWAPLPAIFVRQVNTGSGFQDELVDGQQRVMACLEWLDGKFPATTWDGKSFWARTDQDRRALDRVAMPQVLLPVATTDKQAVDIYLAINYGGTPHTPEDEAKAIAFRDNL